MGDYKLDDGQGGLDAEMATLARLAYEALDERLAESERRRHALEEEVAFLHGNGVIMTLQAEVAALKGKQGLGAYARSVVEHIRQVAGLLSLASADLTRRSVWHDASKYSPEEFGPYESIYERLQAAPYGSDEYRACLKAIKPAIEHHYSVNTHHPEHYAHLDGIASMHLLELVEMCCDWIAAARREKPDGVPDVRRNVERFGIEPQLARVLENTVNYLLMLEARGLRTLLKLEEGGQNGK